MSAWKKKYPPDPKTGHVWHTIDGRVRCLRCACMKHWDLASMSCQVPAGGPWAVNMIEARFGRSRT